MGVREIFLRVEFGLLLDEVWEQIEKTNDEFFGISWINSPLVTVTPCSLRDVFYL